MSENRNKEEEKVEEEISVAEIAFNRFLTQGDAKEQARRKKSLPSQFLESKFGMNNIFSIHRNN
jgi:hypothetical protein